MFVPLHDANRLVHIPFHYMTVALIAANVIAFVFLQGAGQPYMLEASAYALGVIPAELNGVLPPSGPPETATTVSYMFLHGSWLHLLSNMLFLWVFGDNVEDALGHLRYLLFYLLCGMAGGAVHAWIFPASDVPLVGASGAVSGIVVAYLILYPRVKVWGLFLGRIPLRLTAAWCLGAWVALQFVYALVPQDSEVAWWAHVGGLVTGAVLVPVLRRRGIARPVNPARQKPRRRD